ncbi:MAG: hypothetical protein LBN10_03365 [Propionibacteriaceae bacterium]|jgi:hypothetical protein|nr:hypothetical protein [Propionibacteriaceae bacterium]
MSSTYFTVECDTGQGTDAQLIFDSRDTDLSVDSPVLEEAVNKAGVLDFTVPKASPFWSVPVPGRSVATVRERSQIVWRGVVTQAPIADIWDTREVVAEGLLSAMAGVKIAPWTAVASPDALLSTIVDAYNERQPDPRLWFSVGDVTVTEVNAAGQVGPEIEMASETWQSALDEVSRLVARLGGFLVCEYPESAADGVVLHWLADIGETGQSVKFAENMISRETDLDVTSVPTSLVVLGGELEDGTRVTIAADNDGLDYLTDTGMVAKYGFRQEVLEFAGTDPHLLHLDGQRHLNRLAAQAWGTVTANALDLGLTDAAVRRLHVGDTHVVDEGGATETVLRLTGLKRDLIDASKWVTTFGARAASLTSIVTPAPTVPPPSSPKAPLDVQGVSQVDFGWNGQPFGVVVLSWTPVSQMIDGRDIGKVTYQVYGEADGHPRLLLATTTAVEWAHEPLTPGQTWTYQVRALAGGRTSAWSQPVAVLVVADETPPPVPSLPIVASKMSTVSVQWDGLSEDDGPMPPDFDRVLVYRQDIDKPVGTFTYPGVLVLTDLTVGMEVTFRLTAVDTSGNESDPTDWVTVTPVAVCDGDLIGTTIVEQLSEAMAELGTLDSRLEQAETDVAQAQTDAAQAQADIAAAMEEVGANTQTITNVTTHIIPGIQSELEHASTDLSQAQTDVANALEQVGALQETTADMQAGLGCAAQTIADHTDELAALDAQVAQVASDAANAISAAGQASSAASAAGASASSALSQVAQAQTDIEAAQNDVAAHATELSQLNADVSQASSDAAAASVAAGQAASQASDAAMTAAAAQASAMAAQSAIAAALDSQWVKNPDFGDDLANVDNWASSATAAPSAVWTWSAGGAPSGVPPPASSCGKSTTSTALITGDGTGFVIAAGRTVRVEADWVRNSAATDAITPVLTWYDGSAWATLSGTKATGATAWTHVSYDFTIPAPAQRIKPGFAFTGATYASNFSVTDVTTQIQVAQMIDTLSGDIDAASTLAGQAMTAANGKNKITYSSANASGSGALAGDEWRKIDASNVEIARWRWSGTAWTVVTVGNAVIAALDATKITTGILDAARIAASAITADKIAAGSVGTDKLAANAVTAGKIAAGTITATQLAAGAITAEKIGASAVTADKVAANAIVAGKIAAGAVQAGDIAAGVVTATELAAGSVTAVKVAAGAITADGLAANAVTAVKIAAGTITGAKVAAGTLTADKLVIGNSANLVPDPAMTLGRWPATYVVAGAGHDGGNALVHPGGTALYSYAGAVATDATRCPAGKLMAVSFWVKSATDTSASTAHMRLLSYDDANATTGQNFNCPALQANTWTQVTGVITLTNARGDSPRVLFGFYTAATSTGEITYSTPVVRVMASGELIVDGAITAVKVGASAITADKIAASAVTADKLAANSVTANAIAAATITGAKIAAGTIAAGNIATSAITADKIAAKAVTADKIAAKAITADKLVVGSTSNLIPDPGFNQWGTLAWATANATADTTVVRTPGVASLRIVAGTTERGAYWALGNAFGLGIPVISGAKYYVTAYVRSDTAIPAAAASVRARIYGSDGTYTSWTQVNNPAEIPANTWTLVSGVSTVPTTKGQNPAAIPGLYVNGTATGQVWWTEPVIRAMSDGQLIVDGSIVASKIAANAITAEKISAGAITTEKLSSTAIDGMTITGATIQTTATASRGIKITDSELAAWNSSGVKTLSLSSSTGQITAIGQFSSGAGGDDQVTISSDVYGGAPGIKMGSSGSVNPPTIYAYNQGSQSDTLVIQGAGPSGILNTRAAIWMWPNGNTAIRGALFQMGGTGANDLFTLGSIALSGSINDGQALDFTVTYPYAIAKPRWIFLSPVSPAGLWGLNWYVKASATTGFMFTISSLAGQAMALSPITMRWLGINTSL